MHFSSIRDSLDKEAVILSSQACEPECEEESAKLITACVAGLRMLSSHCGEYDDKVRYGQDYIRHFLKELGNLCANGKDGFTLNECHDAAFALMEDMALFVREKMLRTGFVNCLEEEKALINFFEQCGSWAFDERTVLMDDYHVRMPVAVMKGMIMELKELKAIRTN